MSWETIFASEKKAVAVGQRLGVPYTRTLLPQLEIRIVNESLGLREPKVVSVDQDGMGMIGISGVIWDCGLYMADFLCSAHISNDAHPRAVSGEDDSPSALATLNLTSVLDIGCGTGICGVVAGHLGAQQIVFTDSVLTDAFEWNLETLKGSLSADSRHAESLKWRWPDDDSSPLPELLTKGAQLADEADGKEFYWDTVLCSDVLYEKACLPALQLLLRRLKFRKLVLAYKKRHDEPEREFFAELATWCHVRLFPKAHITSINLPPQNVDDNLFILIISPI